jgi:hypothetical protein
VRKWSALWKALDQARLFPRAFLFAYGWLAYDLHEWFTRQPDISTPQTNYISVVWGVFPLLLNFYMQNGVRWEPAPATVTTATATTTTKESA